MGKLTIGVGRNLTDCGISLSEAEYLFEHDVAMATANLKKVFTDCDLWSDARRNALIDMMFNVGPTRFNQFKKMIAAIKQADWPAAAKEMRDSLWAGQVPARVAELAKMVEEGQ